ncbi:MAG: hypothetical protein H6623_01290 [Bdellovibrionaceae bacterium]|nr:hypothetical protein [Pseudobdellovibrionaceae bacterium]
MKILLGLILLMSTSSQASMSYQIDDVELLGQYKLKKADKNSQYQTASLSWDNYGSLILSLNDGEQEFDLDSPDKNGVMRDSEEEYECEDASCGGIAHVKVTLQESKNTANEVVPAVLVEITESWPADETSDDGEITFEDTTVKYSFVWDNNKKDYKVSPVRITDVAQNFLSLNKNCEAVVKSVPLSIYSLHICGSTSAYVFDGSTAKQLPKILKIKSGVSSANELSVDEIGKTFFVSLRKNVIAYALERKKTEEDIKDLLGQLDTYLEFFKQSAGNGNKIYSTNTNAYTYFFFVDESAKKVNILKFYDMN